MSQVNIVMYHYVREIKNSNYPKIKGLEISGFRRQLDYLTNNFNIIKAEDVINFVKNGDNLPEKSCLLTFDDGYKDHLIFALPELLKRNLQGSFFLSAKPVIERKILNVNRIHFILASTNNLADLVNNVNKLCIEHGITSEELDSFKSQYAIPSLYDSADVMYVKNLLQHGLSENINNFICSKLFRTYVNRDELDFADDLYISFDETKKLISSGMYVGSHGYKHLHLNKESYDSQSSEIDLSLKFLKDVGASTIDWIMCYPYGAYNDDTLKILSERNCAVGLTTKVGIAEVKRDFSLELSRFDTNDYPQ